MAEVHIVTDLDALGSLLPAFKQHLRITGCDADADLMQKLQSALLSVGGDIDRVMAKSTVTATAIANSVDGKVHMALRGPVRTVCSVSVNGDTLAEGEGYKIIGNRLCIYGNYRDAIVEVVYKAGYHPMPADLWEAVCLRGAGAYANPIDGVQERLRASDNLLMPYKYREWIS